MEKSKVKIGDVFLGEEEFTIGRKKLDDVVEVCVPRSKCSSIKMIIETVFSKGKLFQFPRERKIDVSSIDKTRKDAVWVVEDVFYREGTQLIHSYMEENVFIRARRMKDNKSDPDGEVIEFFWGGNFINQYNGNLEFLGNINDG